MFFAYGMEGIAMRISLFAIGYEASQTYLAAGKLVEY